MPNARLTSSSLAAIVVSAALGSAMWGSDARADDPDAVARRERCATRLSIALLGESPGEELRGASDPQAQAADLIALPAFRERFARFVNAAHNRQPADNPGADPSYWVTKYVLEQGLPWKDVFVGALDVVADEDEGTVRVVPNERGLGYFRSELWLDRYAGNESEGLRISTAYRIANNTVGLTLSAVTNDPDLDISAKGRAKQPCAGCHQEGWFPLDEAASVLGRVVDETDDDRLVFGEPEDVPKKLLGGVEISSDAELVHALVDSEPFRFHQCRLAFEYLYARAENACEGPIFDACMSAFTETGRIESAILSIATHPSFCE